MLVEERAASGKIEQGGASQESQRAAPDPSAENGLLQIHRATLYLISLDAGTTRLVAYLVQKVSRTFLLAVPPGPVSYLDLFQIGLHYIDQFLGRNRLRRILRTMRVQNMEQNMTLHEFRHQPI
jgi:hypothetical protein